MISKFFDVINIFLSSFVYRVEALECPFGIGARVVVSRVLVQAVNSLHVFLCQVEIEQGHVLGKAFLLCGLRDDGGAALHAPSEHDLSCGLVVLLCQVLS